jgi:hypothetical protein
LELSGGAVLGKGKKSVVEKERNKAAKRVRDGLMEKQKARTKQELEEVSVGQHTAYLTLIDLNSDKRPRIWGIIILRSRSCLDLQLVLPVQRGTEAWGWEWENSVADF